MSFLEDDRPRKKPSAQPGEALADLSVDELKARIATYQAEIERLTREIEVEGEAHEGGRFLLPALAAFRRPPLEMPRKKPRLFTRR